MMTKMAEAVPAALQHIRAGKLRALAVTTPKRIGILPDVPTVDERLRAGVAKWTKVIDETGGVDD